MYTRGRFVEVQFLLDKFSVQKIDFIVLPIFFKGSMCFFLLSTDTALPQILTVGNFHSCTLLSPDFFLDLEGSFTHLTIFFSSLRVPPKVCEKPAPVF